MHYIQFCYKNLQCLCRNGWILDIYASCRNHMSNFAIRISNVFVAMVRFWTYMLLVAFICPISLSCFRFFSLQTMNFGLFSYVLLHYIHFQYRHMHFPCCNDLALDIFPFFSYIMVTVRPCPFISCRIVLIG